VRDPIDFELFKNALFAVADEMALTIFRTSYSGVLKNNMDYSTAVATADGRLAAQGLTIPGHLGSVPTALQSVLARFGAAIAPGDIYIMNDPYAGGMHLPDIFMFAPVFANGTHIAFACTVCHHTDVGGRVAGSNAADSTEIYAEGLRIPPTRLYAAGIPNETMFDLIETNVRMPGKVRGDLRAQLAACTIGERAILDLVTRHGLAETIAYMDDSIAHAERLTRAAIRLLPEGRFSFEDWIDDDGVDFGKPIRLHVTFEKRGDTLHADWSGSAPQVKGAINGTLGWTKAATYCAVKCILPQDIPNNEGVFRAIEVLALPGTITNMQLPAACAARGLSGFRMMDCALGALAGMLPDKIPAASDGGNTGISIGGYDANRQPFIYVEFVAGAWGARPWADGADGHSSLMANMASYSVEVTESEYPVQCLAYELVPDREGAGKYRGGTPFRRDYRFLEAEATLQVRSDRREIRPYGLQGGQPGAPSTNILNPDTEARILPSKLTMTIHRGDVLRHEIAGPGGWGDPLDRDPEAVLKDIRNDIVSQARAEACYGVILSGRTIDHEATQARRATIRAERNWSEPPAVSRTPTHPNADRREL
jgi:N-methylhydantoinase B